MSVTLETMGSILPEGDTATLTVELLGPLHGLPEQAEGAVDPSAEVFAKLLGELEGLEAVCAVDVPEEETNNKTDATTEGESRRYTLH